MYATPEYLSESLESRTRLAEPVELGLAKMNQSQLRSRLLEMIVENELNRKDYVPMARSRRSEQDCENKV